MAALADHELNKTCHSRRVFSLLYKISPVETFYASLHKDIKTLGASVTRFGKISPLGHNFKSLWLFFEGLFYIR